MISAVFARRSSLAILASSFLAATAHGLIKFNDAHDEIFVTASAGVMYDSNIFASADAEEDTSFNATLDLEYLRKAGAIGVNAHAGWAFSTFERFSSEDFANPHLNLEFTKTGGRTTGSLTAGVARESRADTAINLRTTSWNYDAALNLKYPVIERYSVTAQLGYGLADYQDNPALVDIETYTASSDLFYVYTSQRDILGGYRIRVTDTTSEKRSYDHAFTLGTTGKLLPKLNGTVRAGYQFRGSDRNTRGEDTNYEAFTASTSATWTVSRRLTVTGQLSRDFSTLADDTDVDTTSAGLDAQFAIKPKIALFGGIGAGRIRYLGETNSGRRDTYFTYNFGSSYTMNDHLKVSLTFLYYQNWSLADQSDYDRHTISLNVTSRW